MTWGLSRGWAVVAGAGESGRSVLARLLARVATPRAASVLLWVAAFGVAAHLFTQARVWFVDSPDLPEHRRRGDGNAGHAQIDFGGQWVMARMLVAGHGRELYHRQRQWLVTRDGYRFEYEAPVTREEILVPGSARRLAGPNDDLKHDHERLMGWFMGADSPGWRTVGGAAVAPLAAGPFGDPLSAAVLCAAANTSVTPEVAAEVTKPAIGGPLYPPLQAFFYAPLALIDQPLRAYHTLQYATTAAVFLTGVGVWVLTRGRVWCSAATLFLFLFPGCRAGLDLGQNPTITLAVVVWGWALASRGYNVAGGAVWGLLAFKPVWGLAFFLVPLLTGRWRFALAMVLTGCGLVAATLPVVGLQTWFDWLKVGQEAAELYNVNHNWVHLSRDLSGVPRRMLHDFSVPEGERDTALAKALAAGLLGFVFAATAVVYLRYADRKRVVGVGAAFLFLGGFLTCYRFMYYDALLSSVGCVLLLAEPGRLFRTRVFALALTPATPVPPAGRELDAPPPARNPLGPRLVGYLSSFPLTVIAFLLLLENSLAGFRIEGSVGVGYFARVTTGPDGATGRYVPKLQADTGPNYPWETFLVLGLWAWCGCRLICGEERRDSPAADREAGSPAPPG